MAEKKTVSISSDPVFLEELSEYLEVLANPLRLKILKFIEREPREITAIAEHTGMSYQNTKKHLDRLVSTGLVQRAAGFGRETDRGIAPVWKYSLAEGGLENLTRTLGVFSSIAAPLGYSDIRERLRAVRSALGGSDGQAGPVLYVIGGPADGKAFVLKEERIRIGREDPDHPPVGDEGAVVLPDEYPGGDEGDKTPCGPGTDSRVLGDRGQRKHRRDVRKLAAPGPPEKDTACKW